VTAYRELLQNRQSITKQEGAVLANLVSFLPAGEVREVLAARIASARSEPGPLVSFLMGLSLRKRWRALKRVSGSTWLLAGATILTSLVGYLFVKGQSRRRE
jgi:hypothetical protein